MDKETICASRREGGGGGRKAQNSGRPIASRCSGGVIDAPPTHTLTHGLTNFGERARSFFFLSPSIFFSAVHLFVRRITRKI